MNAIKFDEEKVKKCIDAYYDEKGVYPYLIMSEKTKTELLDKSPDNRKLWTLPSYIHVGDTTEKPKECPIWKSAKILFDNDLKFGEVYVR